MKKIRQQTITSKFFIPLLLSLTLLFCLTTVSAADNDTIYVNASGNDSWDGLNATWNGATSGPKLTIKNATGTLNAGGTIYIADGTYTGENNTGITINKNMAIIGQSKSGTIIDAQGNGNIFNIIPGATVIIKSLTLTNGQNGQGGAINNQQGTLILNNTAITNNKATSQYGYGGAILNYYGNITIDNSILQNNTGSNGGAICNYYGNMKILNSIFKDNSATYNGAIYNAYTATIAITNCTFDHNTGSNGGTIYNDYDGTLIIKNSIFKNSESPQDGGAIYNAGTLTVNKCTFNNNNAEGYGGAIYNGYSKLTVEDCIFTDNDASYGGAISTSFGSELIVTGSTFTSNNAGSGGAIFHEGSALTTITDCNFTDNEADYSGGAIIIHYTLATITGCTFIGNTAYQGGAIKVCCGSAKITGSTFADNTAYMGGAIYNGRNLELKYNTIENNKALMNSLLIIDAVNAQAGTIGYGGGIFLTPYSSYEIIGNHILNNIGSGIYIGYPNLGAGSTSILSSIQEEVKAIINFNRIYGNTPYGIYYNNTTEVEPNSVSAAITTPITPVLDAKYNWWGSNAGPNSAGADKTNLESTYYAPWIVMKLTPTKVVINGGEKTLLTASFLYDNNGTYHDPANGHIPDGTPVTFTTSLGQVGSQTITTYTVNGIATAILRAVDAAGNPVSGIALITATTDAQMLSTSVSIIEVPEANAATNTTNTVGMQETGIPIAGLILAILALFGGLVVPKRK